MKNKLTFIRDIAAIKKALNYSISGISYLIRERAFKQELILGVILVCIELFRNTPLPMLLYLLFAYVLILITEALNSAIETLVDRISLEKHELSKKTKDIGSAAVFIALVHFTIAWIVSFLA